MYIVKSSKTANNIDITLLFAIGDVLMTISSQATDSVILSELGGRLAHARLEKNLTQAQLAEQAGLSKRTVERLESGAVATQLSGFIRVCRVLGLVERLDLLVPESSPSPLMQLKLKGKKRQRASAAKTSEQPGQKWEWGKAT